MQIFLINLVRRPDRLRAMTEQFKNLGLAFRRIPAVDAQTVSDAWLAQFFADKGPLGAISKGDKCCTLSHRCAWSAFLSTDAPYGLILEDDVALDRSAADLLQRTDWIPPSVELLKLEHFGPEGQRVLVGDSLDIEAGRSIAKLYSRHTGAGAYIIGRAAAQKLLSSNPAWTLPVDHMLFNPNVSPLADQLRPYQLFPTIARQSPEIGGDTDIALWRAAQRRFSYGYVKREIVRAYYELRLLPQQIAQVIGRQAALVRVRNDGLQRARPVSLGLESAAPIGQPGTLLGAAWRRR